MTKTTRPVRTFARRSSKRRKIRTVDPPGYQAYIQGPLWREKRRQYLASKLPKTCFVCGAAWVPGFELHHRTYARFGNEHLHDLVPLCRPHHVAVHQLSKATGQHIWFATRTVKRNYAKGQR